MKNDMTDYRQIEYYADDTISHWMEITDGDMSKVMDLVKDYIIWTINPNYFN